MTRKRPSRAVTFGTLAAVGLLVMRRSQSASSFKSATTVPAEAKRLAKDDGDSSMM